MITNKYHLEIKKQIEEINNNDCEIKTFRTALLIRKKINYLYKQKQVLSYLHKTYLLNLLNNTLKSKLLKINPNLSKKDITSILQIIKDDYNSLPLDLNIINDDIITYYKGQYDNPYINQIKILSKKNFEEIPNLHNLYNLISTYKTIYHNYDEIKFHNFYNFYHPYDQHYTKKHPSLLPMLNHINRILKPYNNNKPVIEYKYHLNYTSNTKLFINTNLTKISQSILNKKSITFDLISINDWNEIHHFKIKQIVNKDHTYTWKSIEITPKIWNLSESINNTNNKTLTKTRN